MESYFDLGSHSRLITTASEDAQLWFNRGLNWLYGFNHPESVACFQRAAVCDPAAPWPTGASLWPKALTLTNNGPTIASVNCARRLTSATTWHGAPSVWERWHAKRAGAP